MAAYVHSELMLPSGQRCKIKSLDHYLAGCRREVNSTELRWTQLNSMINKIIQSDFKNIPSILMMVSNRSLSQFLNRNWQIPENLTKTMPPLRNPQKKPAHTHDPGEKMTIATTKWTVFAHWPRYGWKKKYEHTLKEYIFETWKLPTIPPFSPYSL